MQDKDVERYLIIALKYLAIMRKYLDFVMKLYNALQQKAEQVWRGTPDNNMTRGGAFACAFVLGLTLATMILVWLHPAPNHHVLAKKARPAAKSVQNPGHP